MNIRTMMLQNNRNVQIGILIHILLVIAHLVTVIPSASYSSGVSWGWIWWGKQYLIAVRAIFGCQRQRLCMEGQVAFSHFMLWLRAQHRRVRPGFQLLLHQCFTPSGGKSLCHGLHGIVKHALWDPMTWEWYLNRHQLSSTAACLASLRNPKCWCLKYVVNYSLRLPVSSQVTWMSGSQDQDVCVDLL